MQTKVVSYKLCTQKLSQLWRNFAIFLISARLVFFLFLDTLGYIWVGVRFKSFIGFYLCSIATLILGIQLYHFNYNTARLSPFFLHFLVFQRFFRVQKYLRVDPTYFLRKVYLQRPYMILLLLKYLKNLLIIIFWPFKSS